MWPWPRGKYQTSPGSKSLVSAKPLGSITVVRTRPSSTNAHSAAVACQCNSRIAPGSSFIDTPAIPFEIGNCVDGGLLAEAVADDLAFGFFQRELERRQLLARQVGIGNVVHEARIAGERGLRPAQCGQRGDAGGRDQKLPTLRIGHWCSPGGKRSCGERKRRRGWQRNDARVAQFELPPSPICACNEIGRAED